MGMRVLRDILIFLGLVPFLAYAIAASLGTVLITVLIVVTASWVSMMIRQYSGMSKPPQDSGRRYYGR